MIEYRNKWLPIEVKWAETVKKSAARHIFYFLDQFPQKAERGYIVFTGNPLRIGDNVTAVPYFEMVDRVLKPFTA